MSPRPPAVRTPRLSDRERQVLAGLAIGLYPKEIAAGLNLSTWTVYEHMQSARRRLGAATSGQAVALAGRQLRGSRHRWREFIRATSGEVPYRDELAAQIDGVVELVMPFGRADVATPTDVFEVEPAKSWSRGLQQAAAYGLLSGRHPNLAVYSPTTIPVSRAQLIFDGVASVPTGITLWIRSANGWAPVEQRPRSGWEPGPPPKARGF